MQYKLRNISEKDFSFEGITISAGSVSEELTPETYQRLLSLYYGHTLMPIDDPSYGVSDVKSEIPKKKEEKEKKKEGEKEEAKDGESSEKSSTEPEKPKSFVCEICKKEFTSNRGLSAHKRFGHKEKKQVETK